MEKTGPSVDGVGRRVVLGLVLLAALSSDQAGAEDEVRTIRESLHRVLDRLAGSAKPADEAQGGRAAAAGKALKAALDAVDEHVAAQSALTGSVSASFAGDEAHPRNGQTVADPEALYKINSVLDLQRGTYPQLFKAKAEVGVQLNGTTLEEDVSSLLFSYDHYAEPWLEAYGFAERVSDSYLSIDQRWEIGAGAYFGRVSGLTRKGARALVPLCLAPDDRGRTVKENAERLRRGGGVPEECRRSEHDALDAEGIRWDPARGPLEEMMKAQVCGPSSTDGTCLVPEEQRKAVDAALDELQELRRKAIESIRLQHARLAWGVAVTLFAEIERATIKTDVGEETKSVPLDGEQKFRLTVRPTLRWWLTTRLKLSLLPYFKLPILPWKRVPAVNVDGQEEERWDVRIDAYGEAEYVLTGDDTVGGEKVSMVASYLHRRDNAPPFATVAQLQSNGVADALLPLSARRRHDSVQLKLKVEWK